MPKKKINAVPITNHGVKMWYVTVPKDLNGGKARREFFRTEFGANERAAELNEARKTTGARLLALPNAKQIAVLQAVEVIGERILELPDAARAYLSGTRSEVRTVAQAVAECLESRKQMGNRGASIKSLSSTIERFRDWQSTGFRDVADIMPSDVDAWLNSLRVAAGKPRAGQPIARPTRRTYLTDLRTLFSFAVSRGYAAKNPAKAIERPAHEDMPRGILTVEQCKKLLVWVRKNDPGMLPCVCLTLFAGIRPDEARWLTAEDFKGKEIIIGGQTAKMRERRVIEANPTLKRWLKLGGEIPPKEENFKERIEAIHKVIQPWPHDCLRHSFVSYRCAIVGIKTAAQEAAHSEDTLLRHYRALTTKADARKFWGLRP